MIKELFHSLRYIGIGIVGGSVDVRRQIGVVILGTCVDNQGIVSFSNKVS
jgi:hypothetical protein